MTLRTTFVVALLVGLAAAAAGYGVFTTWSYREALSVRNGQLQRAYSALNGAGLQYGTIAAVDAERRTIKVQTKNAYGSTGEPVFFTAEVAADAFVALQEMGTDAQGAYTSVATTTPLAPGDLTPLSVGTRVKLLSLLKDGRREVTYLLFGNPL